VPRVPARVPRTEPAPKSALPARDDQRCRLRPRV